MKYYLEITKIAFFTSHLNITKIRNTILKLKKNYILNTNNRFHLTGPRIKLTPLIILLKQARIYWKWNLCKDFLRRFVLNSNEEGLTMLYMKINLICHIHVSIKTYTNWINFKRPF